MSITITNQQLKIAHDIYSDRIHEANLYLELINNINSGYDKLLNRDGHTIDIGRELKHTLYASTYLILYNIIESTSVAIIDAIHEDIKLNDISENELNDRLYKRLLKQLGNYLSGKAGSDQVGALNMPASKSMYIELLNLAHSKSTIFSGNVDLLKLKVIAEDYGFSTTPLEGEPYDPYDLLVIKSLRNNLAHGSYSFSECGKEVTFLESAEVVKTIIHINGTPKEVEVTTITKKFESVERLFNALFKNLNDYLREQNYLQKESL